MIGNELRTIVDANGSQPVSLKGVVDTTNSTSTPLAAGATYTGSWIEILSYGIIFVNVYSDVASAIDGLMIEQSSDGVNADHDDVFTVPADTGKNFSINPYARYLRVSYTNGGTIQTAFRLQTILKGYSKPSSHRIQDAISSDDDAELVKSVITGQDPVGTFRNFQSTVQGNFKVAVYEYGDTSSIDAFNRLRVSEPYTIFDSKQLHDKQPLFWDESIGGSATSNHANAYCNMAVTASATDFVIRQTKQRFNYQPGKSQLILCTFYAPTATGVTQRIGVFDGTGANFLTPYNGIFFENDGGTLSFNVAKNGTVTETITQANWNVDVFDGTGPSGVTLDMDATQILIIDFEALMVGRIRVGFVVDGIIRYASYINHANDPTFSTPYFDTPNLALRYDIQSDGTSAGSLYHICSTVMSEGGLQQTGIITGIDMGVTHLDANSAGTSYALLGIRLKSTYYDITTVPERFTIISLTNDNFRWRLLLNPTVAGTFTFNDVTNSSIQYATGATTNTISGGFVIDSGYGQNQTVTDRQFLTALHLGSTIAGVQDIMVLDVTPYTSNADYLASLTVREYL